MIRAIFGSLVGTIGRAFMLFTRSRPALGLLALIGSSPVARRWLFIGCALVAVIICIAILLVALTASSIINTLGR
jgi:hypothetical protein